MTLYETFVGHVRPVFEQLVAEGVIGAWGLTCIGHPDTIIKLLGERPAPAAVQCIANLLDSQGGLKFFGPAKPRAVMAAARANGVGVMGIRAVRAGALTSATDRPLPARVLTDQLGALLALGFDSGIPATPAEQRDAARLLDQIGRAIRLRYAEPGLTAVAVAEDLRISERTLHRCLNKAGLTFSGLLNDCRIAAARRMLSEPRFDRISVGGIGLRVGLSDPSHFIRQCRKSLGMTPGAFRRQR